MNFPPELSEAIDYLSSIEAVPHWNMDYVKELIIALELSWGALRELDLKLEPPMAGLKAFVYTANPDFKDAPSCVKFIEVKSRK